MGPSLLTNSYRDPTFETAFGSKWALVLSSESCVEGLEQIYDEPGDEFGLLVIAGA